MKSYTQMQYLKQMSSKNDITGDSMFSKASHNNAYADNWEGIFWKGSQKALEGATSPSSVVMAISLYDDGENASKDVLRGNDNGH